MKKAWIPSVAFLSILLCCLIFRFNSISANGVDWHATLYSQVFIQEMIMAIVLLFVVIGYWLLSRKAGRINGTLFLVHFLVSLITAIFVMKPAVWLSFKQPVGEAAHSAETPLKLAGFAFDLFIVAQILFFIYFFGAMKSNGRKTLKGI